MKKGVLTYKVLICDDDIMYANTLKDIISLTNFKNEKFNIDVEVESSPSKCFRLIDDTFYDIIILDICMKSGKNSTRDETYIRYGAEHYGEALYKDIRSKDLQSKIFVNSNLSIRELQKLISDSDVEHFNKDTTAMAKIAQRVITYFDTGKESIYNDVFVVYGHDLEMRKSVEKYISDFGINSIDLLKSAPGGLHSVFDALCECTQKSECAIVLLSPDDIVTNKEHKELCYRARQNVIFEMGLFAGCLGKEKVIVLYKKHPLFEFPSDINGIFYIEYDDSGNWKKMLKENLHKIGFKI